jgi:hypothetical protein
MAAKQKNIKIKAKKNKLMIPKTAQDTIPFVYMHKDSVLYLGNNKYSMCACFDNTDYIMAREEEQLRIFNSYSSALNSLSNNISIQLFLNNVKVDKADLYNSVLVKNKSKSYFAHKDEYNKILEDKIEECHETTAKKELYLILTIEATSIKNAYEGITSVMNELEIIFKKMTSKLKLISGEEYLKLLYYFYNPLRKNKDDFFLAGDLFNKGMYVKDLIVPGSFEFKSKYIQIGEVYKKVLFIRDLPSKLRDNVISNLLECPFNLSVSIHIEPTDSTQAIKNIRRKITGMETNKIQYKKRAGMTLTPYIPYDLETSLVAAKQLLDSLVKSEKKLFYVSIYISITAEELEELKERTDKVLSVCRKHLINAETLTHQQEEGLASAAPIGKDVVKIKRTLLTDSTAIFMPYSSSDLIQDGGFYYGVNQISKSLIILKRSMMENPAGFILGRPRSGKSFACKREILNVLLSTNDDILVIDPEDEYTKLCRSFAGEVIEISANSKNNINPLDISDDYGAGDNPIRLKSEFVLSVFESLIGTLKPVEKTLIDRAVNKIYRNYMVGHDEGLAPTMKTLNRFLMEQEEEEARQLALSMELYVSGSLNMFSSKTNIDIKNRFTVFNTRDLGKQLKTLGMLVVLDFIWNRVCQNWARRKRTWIYIDEFYMLFGSEYVSSFFNEFFKRSQKRGGIPTGITQNVQEILASDMARYMLSNSEFMLMFNQSPADRNELSDLLKITPSQMSYLTDSEEGSGIMLVKDKVIPFIDKFPKDTNLYKMITTKVSDIFLEKTPEEVR